MRTVPTYYLAALGTLISELPLLEPPLDTSALAGLFDQYLSDVLNNSQKRMIELFLARFD